MKNICMKLTAAASVLSLLLTSAAYAAPLSDERVTVIVETEGATMLEAHSAGAMLLDLSEPAASAEMRMHADHVRVESRIENEIDAESDMICSYTHVLNGFAAEVSKSDIEAIRALPSVSEVYISTAMEPDYAELSEEDSGGAYLEFGNEQMNTEYMHDLGYTGKGEVIAVIDTGFDVRHEMLQGEISGARLSKDDIKAVIESGRLIGSNNSVNSVYHSEKIPYAYNYTEKNADTYEEGKSHGMHVAGIAAGNNGTDPDGEKFTGTATDAQLLLMACPGFKSDRIVAAIDDAVKLGADVINCSFGLRHRESDLPERKAMNAARNAGVFISCSAGNDGRGIDKEPVKAENIDYSTDGKNGNFPSTTSVASADHLRAWDFFGTLTVDGNEIRFANENEKNDFIKVFGGEEREYVFLGYGGKEEYADKDVRDKLAVVERGQKYFYEIVENAMSAGANGVIIINTNEERGIGIDEDALGEMPVISVARSDGKYFIEPQTGTAAVGEAEMHEIKTKDKLLMSDFSSWGTTSVLDLDPDITAPGSVIYSSISEDQYKNMSGTSMAAPHIAGAAAIMKQYITDHPEIYGAAEELDIPGLIENLMMSAAEPIMQDDENSIPYSPRLQGAGMVNLEGAAKTPAILLGTAFDIDENTSERSKLCLREIGDKFDLDLKIKNLLNESVTYDKISLTVITDSADENGIIGDMRPLTFSAEIPESITLEAKETAELTIPVSLDRSELDRNMEVFTNGFYVDGFISFADSTNEAVKIGMPFMGFYGDWTAARALDEPYFGNDPLTKETYLFSESDIRFDGTKLEAPERKIMGTNWFVDPSSDEANNYSSESFVGFSPNNDGLADEPTISLKPLRRLGQTNAELRGSDNKVISKIVLKDGTGNTMNPDKLSALSFGFNKKKINALSDGDYTITVLSGFCGISPYKQREKVSMKFYVDREKPVITKCELSDDTRTVAVEASDNRHLMGLLITGEQGGEQASITYPFDGNTTGAAEIDISGFDNTDVTVTAYDYAANTSMRTLHELDVFYEGISEESRVFTFKNSSGNEIKASLSLALYSDNRLVKVITKENTVIPAESSVETFNTGSAPCDELRLFIWDGTNTMEPLYEKFGFKM